MHFAKFLEQNCQNEVSETVKSTNYHYMEQTTNAIANGMNIWDKTNPETLYHRNRYRLRYGALPSSNIMVERAVKKARLCQQTGKGERNVSAYGIAGDGINDLCTYQRVITQYPEEMRKKRRKQQEKARRGKTVRTDKDWEEDTSRGPSLARNIVNHALFLQVKIGKMEEKLGETEYKTRLDKTILTLKSFDHQASAKRYAQQLDDFTASIGKETRQSAREVETGITRTPHMKGEIAWGSIRKGDGTNEFSLRLECIARGLLQASSDKILWTAMINLIKGQDKEKWIEDNPGKQVPEKFTAFKNVSGQVFTLK